MPPVAPHVIRAPSTACTISLSLSAFFSGEQTTLNCSRSTLEIDSAAMPPLMGWKEKNLSCTVLAESM